MENTADNWNRPMREISVFDSMSDENLMEYYEVVDQLPEILREDFEPKLIAEMQKRGLLA